MYRAMYYVGLSYMQDCVNKKEEATTYMAKAANGGVPETMYYLGKMYIEGIGVSVNVKEGMRWINKNAEEGIVEAKEYLKK